MNKTKDNISTTEYISSLDEQTRKDSTLLLETMKKISGKEPVFYNAGTIGFDNYHYKYESGREGDSFVIGFYPRKGKTTIYLMDGTARYSELLKKLGAHTLTGYCLYIKKLSNIDSKVLEEILKESYKYIKSLGVVDKILWK